MLGNFLLKAKWLNLHGNMKRSLYVYEYRSTSSGYKSKKRYIKKTRSGSPFTRELNYLAKQLVTKNVLNIAASQKSRNNVRVSGLRYSLLQ